MRLILRYLRLMIALLLPVAVALPRVSFPFVRGTASPQWDDANRSECAIGGAIHCYQTRCIEAHAFNDRL